MTQQKRDYDVLIIGGGPAGMMAAWELAHQAPGLEVALLEEGASVQERSCPIVAGKVSQCVHCPVCDIMHGFGGAGAFSDGKFNITTEYGGWLTDYLSEDQVLGLIQEVDQLNENLGVTSEVHSTDNPTAAAIRKKALGLDIHLLDGRCKHLGTDRFHCVLRQLNDWLAAHIDLYTHTRVTSINPMREGTLVTLTDEKAMRTRQVKELKRLARLNESNRQPVGGASLLDADHDEPEVDYYQLETDQGSFRAPALIAAPGRAGAEWFSGECRKLGIKVMNNQVDIGLRVELPALVFQDITDAMYEAKLKYQTKQYGDMVRTFCMNPYGFVVAENTNGIITVNGHSFEDENKRSQNTNFALLVSNTFTEPFHEPYRYGKSIASLSNLLGGGVLMQRLGDLLAGRRSSARRMRKSFLKPTLQATPGDLSLVLPKRQLDDIIEMLMALDRLAPGTANSDTLLYGVEVKFYSARMALDHNLKTTFPNFYAVGDGAGITRGLSQAAASGLYAARVLLQNKSCMM